MNRSTDIEAALERSLRKQIATPRLDGRFNAAVWARIAAQEHKTRVATTRPAAPTPARWLLASNVVGIAVTVLLVAVFGIRLLGGVDVSVAMPPLAAEQGASVAKLVAWGSTGVALVFGLMFTPLGRRLRSELI